MHVSFVLIYTIWRFILFFDPLRPRDDFFTGLYSYTFEEVGPQFLINDDSKVKFMIYF